MKRYGLGLALAGILALTQGCSLGPESKSSTDQDRIGAIEININDLVLDHVTCIDGDKTDWKYFSVPSEAEVAVAFAFDEPTAGGRIIIRKATGEEMYDLRFQPGARNIQEFRAMPGHYYLEISCDSFQSEYTIEVSLPN